MTSVNPSLALNRIKTVFELQKNHLAKVSTSTFRERKKKLEQIEQYILAHQEEIIQALYQDLRKPRQETILSEIVSVLSELRYTKKHLKRWLQPYSVPVGLATLGTSSYIHYEAKGQALLIAPWNYPFCLVIKPLISAIAAGCTVMIKPSEFTPATNRVVKELINRIFPESEVSLFEGDADVAQELLALPFHHVFFTGSPSIGKLVMKAAAEHLASVTLELGGKSPLIIDETVLLEKVVDSLIWAKFLNNGQTCIAPDYVLVHQSQYTKLLALLKERLAYFYGATSDGIQANQDYGRIIHSKQFDRLLELLEDAKQQGAQLIAGGESNREDLFIAPTLLTDVSQSMKVMQEEIFGPLLPIIPYDALANVIQFIQRNPKPLSLYIFSHKEEHIQEILQNTSSGTVMINDFLQQFANPELPFGGSNTSGIGKSNGFYGFQQFTNAKAVMHRRLGSLAVLYPPYKKEGIQHKLYNLLTKFC